MAIVRAFVNDVDRFPGGCKPHSRRDEGVPPSREGRCGLRQYVTLDVRWFGYVLLPSPHAGTRAQRLAALAAFKKRREAWARLITTPERCAWAMPWLTP